ncbi:MAG: YbaN family protein [Xanthomonadales bacterium]|nr:YbaN family protein [Xanthomonadales bacterium]
MIANPLLRLLVLAVGWLAVLLGMIGVILPLLPTTPFLLLAAGCFARASQRARRWLLALPVFGPAVSDYQAGRGVALSIRLRAIALVWIGIGTTLIWFVDGLALRGLLVLIAVSVSLFLLSLRGPAVADIDERPGDRLR